MRLTTALIISCLFTTSAYAVEDKLSLDEGFCAGGAITATRRGVDINRLSKNAIQNIKKISTKWGDLDKKYGSTANSCFKVGQPMTATYDCLEKSMPNNMLYGYYKGAFAAANKLGGKTDSEIEFVTNSLCVSVYY